MLSTHEIAQRRARLFNKLGANNLAILPTATTNLRNGDSNFHFRPNSDFYYLTGFTEPEAVAIFIPQNNSGEFILFNRPQAEETTIWEGPCTGQEQACTIYGAHKSWPIHEFEQILPKLLMNKESIYYIWGINPIYDRIVMNIFTECRKSHNNTIYPQKLVDLSEILHGMRLIKSPAEITLMRKAAKISSLAHKKAMQLCHPGINESKLEAKILYTFQCNGARFPAYNPIVGGGKNSCILHYNANNTTIENGDLVLIDAGAEYQYYAADVTRTFPANGKFSATQREIYQLVLSTQLAIIDIISPGLSWELIHRTAVKMITSGLMELGLLHGNLDDLIERKAYQPFYMHGTSHWLGLDTHDVGNYYNLQKKSRILEPGMVFTVEPGIYINPSLTEAPQSWHNIGVRIEDEILVTTNGCEVLSADAPKTIDAIEEIMNN